MLIEDRLGTKILYRLENHKYCGTCTRKVITDKTRCPTCNNVLRTNPRHKTKSNDTRKYIP